MMNTGTVLAINTGTQEMLVLTSKGIKITEIPPIWDYDPIMAKVQRLNNELSAIPAPREATEA